MAPSLSPNFCRIKSRNRKREARNASVAPMLFASSIGATLAFLASRFLFRDLIRQKFGDKLGAIDAGVEKEGGFYLFTLRLVPAFPFFVVNLALGLTSMKVWTFYWVSQLGMLAGTVVYLSLI